jgi:hypothetical protein
MVVLEPARPRLWVEWLLRCAVAGALIGHGAYGAMLDRSSWVGYFAVLGISPSTVESSGLIRFVGAMEIGLGLTALLVPIPALLLFLVLWKVGTELLRPAAGEPIWEFVERASNMLAPLALLIVRGWPDSFDSWFRL